jgi:IMP dehydrogenase/GMP reductase/GMP synthase-like glutamine amidotransferase
MGKLRVGAAVGVGEGTEERVEALVQGRRRCDRGRHRARPQPGRDRARALGQANYPQVDVIGGNIATGEAALALVEAGADGVKVGIGPGSICTTRIVAGVGVPQITAIDNVATALMGTGVPMIADGGIRYSGDIAKAIAAGANSVMMGGMFAGTEEAPGEIILYQGRSYKSYRGMGSHRRHAAGQRRPLFPESPAPATPTPTSWCPRASRAACPTRAAWSPSCYQMAGGLRASMGYCGCADHRRDAHPRPSSSRSRSAGIRESHVHDVQITKEAPNYGHRLITAARAHCPIDPASAGGSRGPPADFFFILFLESCHVMHDKILILDFGSQVTQLIARRVREAHVYCEIHPCDVSDDWVRDFGRRLGIILSGSHASTYEGTTDRAPAGGVRAGRAGAGHLLRHADDGGAAGRPGRGQATVREFGYAEVRARGHTRAARRHRGLRHRRGPRHAQGLDEPRRQGDRAAAGLQADGQHRQLPDRRHGRRGAPLLRRAVPPRGDAHRAGRAMLERFVLDICGARPTGSCATTSPRRSRASAQQVGDEEVILGLSGGVDSVGGRGADPPRHRRPADLRVRRPRPAAPERGQMVMDMFAGKLHAKVIHVDASEQFLGHLKGVSDPEAKRKIIGREFVEVFKAEAAKLKAGANAHKPPGWRRARSTPT